MDVFHDNHIHGNGIYKTKLDALAVNRSFLWDTQEILIPAIYVGEAGAALDICAKIPTGDMAAFLKKWNKARRLSMQTPEEYEQLQADNPGSIEFDVKMSLDHTPLIRSMSSSMRWYPKSVFSASEPDDEGWENDSRAEEWMQAYGCSKDCCWYLERIFYNWKDAPVLSPKNLSFVFQADSISVTAGHFDTDKSCHGETIKTVHPVTGQEYTLTLHKCEQTRHSFKEIKELDTHGAVYPEYCQTLYYSISPELSRSLYDIRDCKEGDPPIMPDSRTAGASAVFFAGNSPDPASRAAVSSMHFKPVSNVQWRIVFQIRPKKDLKINFSI